MGVTEVHEQKETLAVDVYIPGHEVRTTTPLFTRSRHERVSAPGAVCFICGKPHTHESPLEAHHHPVERSFANMIDWSPGSLIRRDFPAFDWAAFDAAGFTLVEHPAYTDEEMQWTFPAWTEHVPSDPYLFVDDMAHNGMLLCKDHHIGKDEGIHSLPFPVFIAQRYGRNGYKFSNKETIKHYGNV